MHLVGFRFVYTHVLFFPPIKGLRLISKQKQLAKIFFCTPRSSTSCNVHEITLFEVKTTFVPAFYSSPNFT